MHDPCTRSRYLQERTTQKFLQRAPVWSRPNTLRRLSQKCFYNSRVLERSQSRVPFCEGVGAFFIVVRSCLLSLQSKPFILAEQASHPCRASFSSLQSKFSETWQASLGLRPVRGPREGWALPSSGLWTWACWARQWAYWARQALSHILSSSKSILFFGVQSKN